ncbi:MAG: hypothetical protein A4E55_00885 [Pelotomaculum sp. PtaU1.Bin035]|nr:MAG: hypothetical protein A4E55_00885 [Pelotomaculum sp. PtaU1.Bin035]
MSELLKQYEEKNHVKNYFRHINGCLDVNDPADIKPALEFNLAVAQLLKNSRWQEKKALVRLINAMEHLYTNYGWSSWYDGREYEQWGELARPAREGTQFGFIKIDKELAELMKGIPLKNVNLLTVQGDALKDLNILNGHVVIINTKAFPVTGDVAVCRFENGSRAINTFLGPTLDGTYAVLPGAIGKDPNPKILHVKEVTGVVLASVDLASNIYYRRKNNEGFGHVTVEELMKQANHITSELS